MNEDFYDENIQEFDNGDFKIVQAGQIERPVINGYVTIRDFEAASPANGKQLVAKYEHDYKVGNVLKNYEFKEMSLDERQQLVSEVMMRFDTNPQNYLKDDFYSLIKLTSHAALDKLTDMASITKQQIDDLFK